MAPPPGFATRRRSRKKTSRERAADALREAQESRLLRFTLDVNDLRQELHRLTTLRALTESRRLARPGDASEQLVRTYFTLYRHGLDLQRREHAAFIRASLASDFTLGTTPFGADMFFEQWARHTALFRLRFVELAALHLVPSDAALVARLVDREIVTHANMVFYVDVEHRIPRLDVDVDMVAAFGELLGHNPYDVAALLGHVAIAEESMLGDEVRLASDASVQGDELAAAETGSCGHFSRDALLDRLDEQLASCLDVQLHRRALDDVKERVTANEFDKQRPLALVAFSNSTRSLDALAGAFATALFADAGRQDGVRVLDLASLVPSVVLHTSSNRDVKRQLRTALAALLTACPQRSLLVVDNLQALDDATLPVLDVFLDPLNGERAQLQVPDTDTGTGRAQLLDASSTIFLFLYKVDSAAFDDATVPTWRDFLMAAWSRKEGLVEEFTPQAFVGRLTDGIELFASDEDAGGELSVQCRAHKREPQSPATSGAARWDDHTRVALGLVVVFALLYCVKLWRKGADAKLEAKRGPIRNRKKATKGKGSSAKRTKRKHSK